jgi:prolyl oligopeptidase
MISPPLRPLPLASLAFGGLLLGGCVHAPPARIAYPPARTADIVDDYHGTRVADPYRWTEALDAPEVRTWAAAQTALFERQVRADPLHGAFVARLNALAQPYEAWKEAAASPDAPGDAPALWLAAAPAGTHRVLMTRDASGAERVLVDPTALGPGRDLTRFGASPDGRMVAYAISTNGSEWVETRLRRVADGQDLPETVRGLFWDPPTWSPDSRGFFYVHQERPGPGDPAGPREPSVRYHAAGTPQSHDRVLYRTPPGTSELVLETQRTEDGRYLLVHEGTGAHWDHLGWIQARLLVLDLQAPPGTPPVALTDDRVAGYRLVRSEGPVLTLLTDRGAPRKRVVAVDLRDPAPDRWRDVISESGDVLHRIEVIGGRLVALYLRDLAPVVRVFDAAGRLLHTLPQPALGTVVELRAGGAPNALDVVTTEVLHPFTTTRYDLATGDARVLRTVPARFDTAALEVRRVWFPSRDGTRVPMLVVHRRGLARDGSHPTLLYAYGASGTVLTPRYDEFLLAWAERGGIAAMANLRGGGEFGRAWYEAAILDRKQTTIDDFVAAAEHLIAEGYTRPERLAIGGVSNGGLLVAATLTQRPDLFAAAIPEVPLTDNLRGDRGRHRGQFGVATDPAQFPFLYAYSPLHRVRPGTCYPATLLTTALNDDRAPAWHALKMTAALQAAQRCNRPILLRADTGGGHGVSLSPEEITRQSADVLAFAARRLGLHP